MQVSYETDNHETCNVFFVFLKQFVSPLSAWDWHISTELDLKVYWDKTQNFCCDLSVPYTQITRFAFA